MFTAAEREEINLVKASLLVEISQIMKDEQYSPDLVSWITNYGILTGGASASMFHREKPNDYDIYFENSQTIGHVERYLTHNPGYIKDVKEGYIVQDSRMDGKVWSSRAITLRGDIQLIIMHTADIRSLFDFEHCKPWLHIRTRKYFISEQQYRCIKTRTLIPGNSDPSQHRIFKFEERGWTFQRAYLSPIPVDLIPVPPGNG